MAGFEITGFDELQHELERMQQAAEDLAGERIVPFDELFSEEFMREYTCFSSFDDLLEAGGFHADTNEDFDAIPDDELDTHIANSTQFDTWEEMLDEATERYVTAQLGF